MVKSSRGSSRKWRVNVSKENLPFERINKNDKKQETKQKRNKNKTKDKK